MESTLRGSFKISDLRSDDETWDAAWEIMPLHAVHSRREEQARAKTRAPVGGAIKRTFDFLAALCGLIVLSPLLLLIGLGVRMTSPGPALFRQRRGGLHGRRFLIYKFRTMTAADDGNHVAQATGADPRITWFGGILRKTSLDELPQLLNVLKGEMSIVGPRPHAVAHDTHFAQIDPRYRRRCRARPGITGLAQVSGSRGETDTPEAVRARVDHDIAYIEDWSFWSDCWIVLRTLTHVFGDDRAY